MSYAISQVIAWGLVVPRETAIRMGALDFEGPDLPAGVFCTPVEDSGKFVLYVHPIKAFESKPDKVLNPVIHLRDIGTSETERMLIRQTMGKYGVDGVPDWLVVTQIV